MVPYLKVEEHSATKLRIVTFKSTNIKVWCDGFACDLGLRLFFYLTIILFLLQLQHLDAVLMYREAVMIQSQIFGPDHLSVANSLHNLGNCYRDLCDFDRSAECLSKSLSLSTITIGEEHEDVADTCHCLALTLTTRCELDDAIPLFERALAIRRKRLGGQNLNIASTLYNLGELLILNNGILFSLHFFVYWSLCIF